MSALHKKYKCSKCSVEFYNHGFIDADTGQYYCAKCGEKFKRENEKDDVEEKDDDCSLV